MAHSFSDNSLGNAISIVARAPTCLQNEVLKAQGKINTLILRDINNRNYQFPSRGASAKERL